MTLSAARLLSAVVTALFSAYPGRLYRLGVHNACAGLRVPAEPPPQPLAQLGVQALPRPVEPPPPKPVVEGLPRREVPRQHAPGAAAFEDVEDGVEDRP